MGTGNPLLGEASGEEGLPWGILGEYGYAVVISFHITDFPPFLLPWLFA